MNASNYVKVRCETDIKGELINPKRIKEERKKSESFAYCILPIYFSFIHYSVL